jgi:hypothetical protein
MGFFYFNKYNLENTVKKIYLYFYNLTNVNYHISIFFEVLIHFFHVITKH